MNSSTPGLTEHPPQPEWLQGSRGRLAYFPYPAQNPWLRVLISHGFSEHGGWWHHVARALAARGIATTLYDQYHHGQSDGAPGDVASYDDLIAGFELALAHSGEGPREQRPPLVVLAHSNGALIALLALEAIAPATVPGLVLSAPFLEMPPHLALFGSLLARLLHPFAPRLKVANLIRPHRLTTHRPIWPQYTADPLRFRFLTPRFFLAMRRAIARAASVSFPPGRALLVLRAGEEQVVSLPALERFFRNVPAQDKTLREYPGLRHELFNAPQWEAVVEDVVNWCRVRFGGDSTSGG